MRLLVAFGTLRPRLKRILKRRELCQDRLDYIASGMRQVTAPVNTVMSLPLTDDAGILNQPSERVLTLKKDHKHKFYDVDSLPRHISITADFI